MLKKVMTMAVLGISALGVMAANATTPGFYVEGQAGYANTHNKNKLDTGDNFHNNGLAGRLAVGYQLNQNLALEMGYLRLHQATYKVLDTTIYKLNQSAIDLALKGSLPVSEKFDVYGKLGAAYVTTQYKIYSKGTSNQHKWAPEVAVGMTYNISPNLFVDTSLTHIQSKKSGKNSLPGSGNIDFAAVGIGYSFG